MFQTLLLIKGLLCNEILRTGSNYNSIVDIIKSISSGTYYPISSKNIHNVLQMGEDKNFYKERYFGHKISDINNVESGAYNIKRQIVKSYNIIMNNDNELIDEYIVDIINEYKKNSTYNHYPLKKRLNTIKNQIFFDEKERTEFISFLNDLIKIYERKNDISLNVNFLNFKNMYRKTRYKIAKTLLNELNTNIEYYENSMKNVLMFLSYDDKLMML